MRSSVLITAILVVCAKAAPAAKEKRQDNNLSQLLELASLAGITALPTDPAVLLSLGPIAGYLASELPTAPVLSVLETAAPSGFLSEILHDPSFASSFESAFAAGTPPAWFQSLPTAVKSYLHTYSDYGGVATAAGEINSVINNGSATGMASGSGSATGTGSSGMMTITSAPSSAMGGESGIGGVSAGPNPTTTATPANAGGPSSSVSHAMAPRETGLLSLGIAGVVGVLGLAVAL